jgi:hypothetical protein
MTRFGVIRVSRICCTRSDWSKNCLAFGSSAAGAEAFSGRFKSAGFQRTLVGPFWTMNPPVKALTKELLAHTYLSEGP